MTTAEVTRIDPRHDEQWCALSRGAGGSLFTSPPWISAICRTYGFEPSARVVHDAAGRAVGGLTWIDVVDIRGRRRLALPFCDRADPVLVGEPSRRAADWRALSADVLDDDMPFTLRCLDGNEATTDPRLRAGGVAAWHGTSLDLPIDELHARLRSQLRRNIAKSARSGVRVVLGADLESVRTFHDLHVGLRKRKYGLLAQPREFFEQIWHCFAPGDGIRTGLAYVDGVPVAGAMYLVWADTVYYKFGASLSEYLPVRPNDALHWAAIRWAHERGLRLLDWGLSDLDQPGLVAYKGGWHSEERRITTLRGGTPQRPGDPDVERTLGELTALLTDPEVPDRITSAAGAALYRYFC